MDKRIQDELARFDPEVSVERAWALPRSWYVEPEILDLERAAVLGRTWQYVGPAERVAEPGQFLTAPVAEEPVLVVRGDDGVLRAFSNVCRHRAGPVAACESGRASVLRCGYHGWTYSLTGQLKGTPDFEGVQDFDRGDVRLPALYVRTTGPFVFVALESDLPWDASWWPDLEARGLSGLRFAERRTYEVDCNWKVYLDNFLDGGYHIPHIHPGLMGILDYASYRCETHDGWNVQVAPMRPVPSSDGDYAVARKGDTAFYYWTYPNFTINVYDGVLETNLVLPRSLDRTSVVFDYFFPEDADAAFVEGSIRVSEQVQEEDRRICEAVWQGVASRWYDRGRFSVRRENGGHQFHVLLARALQAAVRERVSIR